MTVCSSKAFANYPLPSVFAKIFWLCFRKYISQSWFCQQPLLIDSGLEDFWRVAPGCKVLLCHTFVNKLNHLNGRKIILLNYSELSAYKTKPSPVYYGYCSVDRPHLRFIGSIT